MTGREEKKMNDLFFLCSLIEYVVRKTKNERKVIVNAIGRNGLEHIHTYWDIGKVMHRLVAEVARHSGVGAVDALVSVYNSWIVPKIDNYNSSMYYENTSYQYASYKAGRAL